MITVTSPRWGRYLFGGLWALGLALLTAIACGLLPPHPLGVLVIVVVLGVSIAVGVISQRCGFFAQPLIRVDGVADRLALTFDDGPDEEFTPKLLELLAQYDQRATFFVIGHKVKAHPDLVRRIVAEGHELGNHTLGHTWHLALWSAQRIAAELEQASALIEEVAGRRPALFRPPAGVLSPRIAAGARAAGLRLVGFTVRSGDGSPLVSARRALRRLRRGLRPGAILVLHDGVVGDRRPTSLDVLPRLCEEMTQNGLRSVPLGELIAPEVGVGANP
jgi:peptidoglycan/xylan/chitin deacetylase (PgdA/CDA1 family)